MEQSFDHRGFLGELARLAPLLLTSDAIEQTLQEVALRVARRLGLRGAAISLADSGLLACVAASSPAIRELEDAQNSSREGPGFDAFRTGQPVLVPRFEAEPFAWPVYRPYAERLGIQAIAAVPLVLDGAGIGVVDLYCSSVHEWTMAELESLVVLAEMTTAYVLRARGALAQNQLVEQLQGALDSRVIIEQAKGMLARAHQESVGVAFDRIQRYARAHHASVREVAHAVVHLGLDL